MSFDLENIVFFDTETRARADAAPGDGDVTTAGAYRYARNAVPILLSYAIGNGPVKVVEARDLDAGLTWAEMPADLRAVYEARTGVWAAWNAAFDRLVTRELLDLEITEVIDVMAQAVASNLPAKLEDASRAIGRSGKQQDGKALIKLFCSAGGGTPETHPAEWERFKSYAAQDIEEMREVYLATRSLPASEWAEYWASEAINDRGMAVDVEFAEAAAELAIEAERRANVQLAALTNGWIKTVNQHAAIAAWILEKTDRAAVRDILLSEATEDTDEPKSSLRRENVARLIAYFARLDETEGLTDTEYAILQVLEIREFGASATPKKFAKIVAQHDGGVLRGQYVFNGAQQTGRFSSRGVQVHNLTRAHLGVQEAGVIDYIIDRAPFDIIAEMGEGQSVARKLSLLIRPTFIAREGCNLVWGDWSQIEARVLPWLSNTTGGEIALNVFRAADDDKNNPDNYVIAAAQIYNTPVSKVWADYRGGDPEAKRMRQIGKVAVLSLGFGGGVGAFQAMAGNYGVYIDDDRALAIVEAWRAANPWARAFWGRHDRNESSGLWGAANRALEAPLTMIEAGRVAFAYDPDYMRGSLFMGLPCGRLLTYPRIKWEDREVEDKKTGKKEWRRQLTYLKSYGRAAMWYGKLAENATQAAAGSLLRGKLVTLQDIAVGHTHDEIIAEASIADTEAVRERLLRVMTTNDTWNAGLPLAASATVAPYYSKALGD